MLLAEELMLILLDNESGQVNEWSEKITDIGLASAIMADLVISGAVEVVEPSSRLRSSKVRVANAAATTDPILRDALQPMRTKELKTSTAISQLRNGLRDRLLLRLNERGIVERQVERFQLVRTRSIWPAVDTSHKRNLRAAIEHALFSEGELSERHAVLLRLLVMTSGIFMTFPAATADVPYPRRVLMNFELQSKATAMTDRTWTHAGLTFVFKAGVSLMPSSD